MGSEWDKIRQQYQIAVNQDWRCMYCNYDLLDTPEAFASSEWDHFDPRAKEGTGVVLVLTCHMCNSLKRDSVFETVEEARAVITKRRTDYLTRWDYESLVQNFRKKRP